jgi:hypothetical protein
MNNPTYLGTTFSGIGTEYNVSYSIQICPAG